MWSIALVVALTAAQPTLTPALEREARALETEFVAPCCWSQQVSVHQSPAADEIRRDVRVRLARGETHKQIVDDYVVQFGERILVEPPARGYKLFLYVFPPVALVLSAAGIVVLLRRFTRTSAQAEGTAAAETGSTTVPGRESDRYRDQLDEELRDLD